MVDVRGRQVFVGAGTTGKLSEFCKQTFTYGPVSITEKLIGPLKRRHESRRELVRKGINENGRDQRTARQ